MAKLEKQNIPFTQIANEVLESQSISWEAKGMFSYLFSKPDSWEFAADRIVRDSPRNSKGKLKLKRVYRILKELEQNGFLTRRKRGDGKVVYFLSFSSKKPTAINVELDAEPTAQKGNQQKRQLANMSTISNKEEESNKKEEVINPTAGGGKEINEIIFLFKAVNPMIQRLYGSPPQRKSVERMMKEFGREKLESMIQALPKINGQKYWPKSTTPVQLENNIAVYLAKKSELETKQADSKIKVAIIA